MKILFIILFLIVIGYYSYKFFLVLFKMKQTPRFPTTNEECVAIRKYPQKVIDRPHYSNQKLGITTYALMLVALMTIFFVDVFTMKSGIEFLWLFLLPLIHLNDLFNTFAVVDDGILCGSQFVSWSKIKSFHFKRIDVTHQYYGFSKEVNDAYELKIELKVNSLSCIVTSNEVKEKLAAILEEHIR